MKLSLAKSTQALLAALVMVPLLATSSQALAARKPKVVQAEQPEQILNKDTVNAAVEDQLSTLHRCYLVAARKHAGVVVKMSVAFEIAPDGHVPSAKVIKNNHTDGLFESCIVDTVRSWGFNAPAEGTAVRVTYPLVFSAEDGGTVKAEKLL